MTQEELQEWAANEATNQDLIDELGMIIRWQTKQPTTENAIHIKTLQDEILKRMNK